MKPSQPDKAALAFHDVIEKGTMADLTQAMADGAQVNAGGHVGQTGLMVAIQVKSLEKMLALLEAGADPELTDDFNATALAAAVGVDFVEGVELLPNLGVDQGFSPKYPLKKIDYASLPSFAADEFVDEMMKTAGATAFGDEHQAEMWRSFMSEAVAKHLVEQGGVGLSGSVSQMIGAYTDTASGKT